MNDAPSIPGIVFGILRVYLRTSADIHNYRDFRGRWEGGQEIKIRPTDDVCGHIIKREGRHLLVLDPECICVDGGHRLSRTQFEVNRLIETLEVA